MAATLSTLLLIFAGVVAIPVLVFCIEILLGIMPRNGSLPTNNGIRRRVAVLVPAHNEGAVLVDTLDNIKEKRNCAQTIDCWLWQTIVRIILLRSRRERAPKLPNGMIPPKSARATR